MSKVNMSIAPLCAAFISLSGCAEIPRAESEYKDLVADLSARIRCELAVNYGNILAGREKNEGGSFKDLVAAYSLEIDTGRTWSVGVGPLKYIQPIVGVLDWSVSSKIENNAHRLVKVTYTVEPATLNREMKKKEFDDCKRPPSYEYSKMYPGNFKTDEWFNQLASISDHPHDIGYTVDFTTTISTDGGLRRAAGKFDVSPSGSFKRTLKNTVDFAFTFKGKQTPSQTNELLRQILISLERARAARSGQSD
ncbi:hypothetical protein ACQZ4Z_13105 [Agrobacterium vitis]|uniref:hypothetical protein n=1 Tax=Agrobacterium vitis TaxID=373 RepID=UPI001573D526|nr:hypothetical protein [Agrobacterium vitis]NSZ42852.1 hypothetical protein [Agrobacterium vitis]